MPKENKCPVCGYVFGPEGSWSRTQTPLDLGDWGVFWVCQEHGQEAYRLVDQAIAKLFRPEELPPDRLRG